MAKTCNIEMIVDMRESDIIERLREKQIPFTVKQLDIGDIMFVEEQSSTTEKNKDDSDNKQNIVLVIERKSVSDLKASICDGRSREQKSRLMNGDIHISRIVYLIEGNMNKKLTDKISGMTYDTLVGSLINTMFRDNIKVYKTYSMTETVEFLEKLLNKINKDYETLFSSDKTENKTDQQQINEYCSVIKHKKSDNLTSNVLYITTLTQIPRMSVVMASAIAEKYHSLIDLVRAYDKQESDLARHEMLSEIKYNTKSSSERRIGKVMSKRVYEFVSGG